MSGELFQTGAILIAVAQLLRERQESTGNSRPTAGDWRGIERDIQTTGFTEEGWGKASVDEWHDVLKQALS